jgi:glycerol-3-phosphate acyltransferase PlsX
MKISVDIMGGDNAPKEIILGCKKYIEKYPEDNLIMIGTASIEKDPDIIYILQNSSSKLIITDTFVEMNESPLMIKKDKIGSSIVKSMELLKNKSVDCTFSCGNSGASILSAMDIIGLKDQYSNASLLSFIPIYQRDPMVLMDAGAMGNRQFNAETYLEITNMAYDFYKSFFNNNDPVIKLLNIGKESWKGTKDHKALFSLLKESIFNFHGNVEGDGILRGDADIIIADGFTGNVILKLLESMYDLFIKDLDKTHCNKSNNFLHFLVEEFNYESLGGAPLLGVNGKVVLGHGKSSSKAIFSGLKFCRKYAQIN